MLNRSVNKNCIDMPRIHLMITMKFNRLVISFVYQCLKIKFSGESQQLHKKMNFPVKFTVTNRKRVICKVVPHSIQLYVTMVF